MEEVVQTNTDRAVAVLEVDSQIRDKILLCKITQEWQIWDQDPTRCTNNNRWMATMSTNLELSTSDGICTSSKEKQK